MPANKKIHMTGLSAVCWAVWKTNLLNDFFYQTGGSTSHSTQLGAQQTVHAPADDTKKALHNL
jgi:hypothetical protein